jgi:glutamate-ammonia-ligase adenylyltransferase
MKAVVWQNAAKQAADLARARHGFEQLAVAGAALSLSALTVEQACLLAALFSGSPVMSALLSKHPDWVQSVLTPEHLAHPRREQGLRREVNAFLQPALQAQDFAGAFSKLRHFKQREMLRIAARDLARLGDAPQITREISNVADVCLNATLRLCREQLTQRVGQPYHLDANGAWQPTQFVVLGLGKLGGQELNYSSDVDVMFLYSEEGHVFKEPPRKKTDPEHALTNHQFFKRLAEAFIAEVSRVTPDGTLYRIDLRLRPEGDAGPLARGLASYENFYAQWGQTWERMMLIKARGVAGDAALAAEFIEMVQPFRYPRSLGEGALREIAAMKTRLENEIVRAGEVERNVKLGRGGIREIEFVVQTAQLLNAGRIPFLQGAQTLPLLEKMVQYKLLAPDEARDLAAAYCFLRDVEHRLQMEHNLQTHTIPSNHRSRERLAALMGFAKLAPFDTALKEHSHRVREIYEKFVQSGPPETGSPFPKQFQGAEAEWKRILAEHNFKDVERAFRLLNELANGPGYVHVSQRTTELAMQLIPKIFALCRHAISTGSTKRAKPKSPWGSRITHHVSRVLSDPDRVLARLDRFITAYGARAVMFETWTANPHLFELLLLLFDRSEFLAEIAIRTPDLVDELVLSGRLGRSKSADEILRDLRHGRADADQRLWLRRYHQAEFMRIGLRSILGLADYEQNFVELTALADACLQYGLEAVLLRHRLKASPLVIIGLGKLGGCELNYGSDLDILFVADDKANRSLPKLQKLAIDLIDLLSSPTELGVAFLTDARLRPDGEKGLLVNTLAAHEEYYRHRGQLWEIQALTRTRPIAGDMKLGQNFQQLAAELTNFQKLSRSAAIQISGKETRGVEAPRSVQLACFTLDWKQQIARMRSRIEKERTPPGQDALAFKTGRGALIDAEFIAQAMCLEHGWQEANTLRALERARREQVLAPADADKLIDNYRQLRRLENILRRWSFEGEAMLPADPAAFYRVAVRCGFATAEAFREALGGWRRAIRKVYEKVFALSKR